MLGIDPKAARCTFTAAIVLLLFAVVYLIRGTLLVFVVALLLAYLLFPLMDLIGRRLSAKTRTPALALTFILVIGLAVLFGAFIGSIVAEEANNLARTAPAFLDRMRTAPPPGPQSAMSVRDRVVAAIEDQVRRHYNEIVSVAPRLTLQVLAASRNLIYIVIVPILSFFILKDGRRIQDAFLEMFLSGRQTAEDTLLDAHTMLLQYMRALLLQCMAVFISFSIVLSLMRVPDAILLASMAFLLEFVPMVGPMMSAFVIVAVSIMSGYHGVLWVIAFLGVYRLFQDYVLSPRLMSKGTALHPLLVMFGVFAGGEMAGVAGMFLSVPTLALLRLLYHRLRKSRVTAA
ncbi:MAG: AI-2E family transporter [Bryobacteraceae bacterium]